MLLGMGVKMYMELCLQDQDHRKDFYTENFTSEGFITNKFAAREGGKSVKD